MINPFFVPVTHIDPIISTIEGVALIGLAALLGVAELSRNLGDDD